jgi:hypothetical protein
VSLSNACIIAVLAGEPVAFACVIIFNVMLSNIFLISAFTFKPMSLVVKGGLKAMSFFCGLAAVYAFKPVGIFIVSYAEINVSYRIVTADAFFPVMRVVAYGRKIVVFKGALYAARAFKPVLSIVVIDFYSAAYKLGYKSALANVEMFKFANVYKN